MTSRGAELIAAERRRQVEVEGWTPEHDAQHRAGELEQAAAYYSMVCTEYYAENVLFPESWDRQYAKRQGFPFPTERDLVKAGALIAAEIDRRLLAGEEA